MVSRRDFLTLAATGLGFGAGAELDEIYTETFPTAEISWIETEGWVRGHFTTPYIDTEPESDSARVDVYDMHGEIALGIHFQDEDLDTGTIAGLDIEDAKRLRDVLTVAIEANEEWGIKERPNEPDWRGR